MEEVPRRTSLAPFCVPLFCTLFNRGGIMSIVWWNLRPVIFGVDSGSAIHQPEGLAVIIALVRFDGT